MKKLLVTFGFITLLTACGYNPQEQMLYDYVNDGIKKVLNTEAKEIGFKIIEFKEVEKITAKDSMDYEKRYLASLYFSSLKYIEQHTIDTLSYEYVISKAKKLEDGYQKLILLNIEQGESYRNYEYKEEWDKYMKLGIDAKASQIRYDRYKADENKVLSTKYFGKYSAKNPLLNNIEQTLEKYYFSDATNTKIIKDQDIE